MAESTYTKVGNYYAPDLILDEEPEQDVFPVLRTTRRPSVRFFGRHPPAAPILPVGYNGSLFAALAPFLFPPKNTSITCSAMYDLRVHGTAPDSIVFSHSL